VYAIVEAPRGLPPGALVAGVTLSVAPWRRDSGSPLTGRKTLAYLDCLLARREARASGHHDAVLVDGAGRPVECAASNLFWVLGGTLCTPALDSGALPGVMRELVLEQAPTLGMACEQRCYTWDELGRADEVMVTNALAGVLGVRGVEGHVELAAPGPMTERLAEWIGELAGS
ncbi:aminotransferase class IV, partial [Planctomycetota bacterium]